MQICQLDGDSGRIVLFTWKFWLFKRSTRRIAQRGKVKPFPLGPAPWVCPEKAEDVEVLAVWTKLEGVVEKQI
jgi:hypothetical protein